MKAVQAGLHSGAEDSLVKHIRLVGMLLLVYCKKEHFDQVAPYVCNDLENLFFRFTILGLTQSEQALWESLETR